MASICRFFFCFLFIFTCFVLPVVFFNTCFVFATIFSSLQKWKLSTGSGFLACFALFQLCSAILCFWCAIFLLNKDLMAIHPEQMPRLNHTQGVKACPVHTTAVWYWWWWMLCAQTLHLETWHTCRSPDSCWVTAAVLLFLQRPTYLLSPCLGLRYFLIINMKRKLKKSFSYPRSPLLYPYSVQLQHFEDPESDTASACWVVLMFHNPPNYIGTWSITCDNRYYIDLPLTVSPPLAHPGFFHKHTPANTCVMFRTCVHLHTCANKHTHTLVAMHTMERSRCLFSLPLVRLWLSLLCVFLM